MQSPWHSNLQHTRRECPSRCGNRSILDYVCGSTSRPHHRTPDTRGGRSQGNMLGTYHPQQDHRYCRHGQHRSEGRGFQGGLGCKVVAYDPLLPKDAWADIPHVRAATLEDVLDLSDIVTLHIPLLPQTRGLISYPQLERMRRNAILINTARGGIVDEADLQRALQEKLIFGAGLDCHEQEPPTREKYGGLWATGRVVSTPHIGAATAETQLETATAAIDRLADFIAKSS
jgi:hypothetical protein